MKQLKEKKDVTGIVVCTLLIIAAISIVILLVGFIYSGITTKTTEETIVTNVVNCEENRKPNAALYMNNNILIIDTNYKITVHIDGIDYIIERDELYREGESITVKKIIRTYKDLFTQECIVETIVE